jgi:arsenate reductase
MCSKSCEALSILENAKEDILVVDYLHQPPSIEMLTTLITQLGIPAANLVRKNEPIYKQLFADKKFTDAEWIEILTQYPILIERPIVIKNGKAMIGRPPHLIKNIL